ncbi:sirohydrochlorin ferrochelatase [Nocardia transvalensis]|uniref:Sirohydrochlorin ferrochelatase n=1 Tax=Nocardia transvalensis TaxID=37333 RepID=A0A7W9PA85_9NOCA|nr:sirohydrochlorin chelatase [Nocardia transvalensis]MBB5912276.1 sirohydrochlorin ferrochelatase [Nocardia transvalensis]
MSAPALVLVAHGTRSARGVGMIADLAAAVTRELGAVTPAPISELVVSREVRIPKASDELRSSGLHTPLVRTAFVDVLGPSPSEVLRDLGSVPAVVVPAFLASGYHVYQDVPREVAESEHPSVAVTPALGPDPALARIMRLRLREAGWRPGDAVVFAAAGSSDARARHDVRRAARMLGDHLRTPVPVAYIATGTPRVPEVVAALRESGARRVFIASYLLAHGLFHQRLHEAGADGVAAPLGVHPAAVHLLLDRYTTAARTLTPAAA